MGVRKQPTPSPPNLQENFPAELLAAMQEQTDALPRICHSHGVDRLDVFGSAVRADFSARSSDLDLVVEFSATPAADTFSQYFELKADLEAMFGRQVDLVELPAVRSERLRKIIQQTRRTLYEAPR